MEATRERILAVAIEAFSNGWYDEVTLRGIAADARVALQTVVNHFGTKEELFAAVAHRLADQIEAARFGVAVHDPDGAVEVLVDDYERTGSFALRLLAVEERVPAVRPAIELGRAGHERWVTETFGGALAPLRGAARARRLSQLIAVTDVYTWKLLRHDRGLSRHHTVAAIRELVAALHPKEKTDG